MFAKLANLLPQNSRQQREELSQRVIWGHWFALFNIVLALLIASRYAFNADWPNTLFGKIYFFISLFGHFGFVVFALYLLLLFPLSFLIKNQRTFRGISVILATVGMSLLLLDTEVFKRFYLHLSPLVWDLLINPDEGELSRQWQLLFVPMPLILLLEMLYSRWCWHKLRSFSRQKWGKGVALFFVICFSATHLIYAGADMTMYRPITAQKANYPLSYPMTARSFLEKHGLIDSADFRQTLQEKGRLDTFFLNYPKNTLQFEERLPTTNILLVNFSELSPSDITAEKMPVLHGIQQQSFNLTKHYSSGDTPSASLVGLFYGLSGRYLDALLAEQKPSPFIQRLQQANYQFGLFSHNGFNLPIYRRALFTDFKLPKTTSNSDALGQWQKWLTKRQTVPFFSYLELSYGSELDSQVETIWQSLVREGLTPNTLVIFTADLAHSQNEQGENMFSQERIQVPMFFYWQNEAKNFNTLSSHIDIMPTLMKRFLGSTSPIGDYAQGIDLSEKNDRKWLLSSNYRWNVAILPNGDQYRLDRKGEMEYYNTQGEKQADSRPPLALFLQLLQQSNQFVEN